MKYKRVEIEDNLSNKRKEETKKIIHYEYIVHTIISIIFAAYNTINLGYICHNLAEKYNFKIDGITEGYSFLGGYRDLSDYQWKYYRTNLGLIVLCAIIFVLISKMIKNYFSVSCLKIYYLIFGLGYALYLHRIKMIYLILVLVISYSLCCNYSYFGRNVFIAITWIFVIFIKVTSEIYKGFSFNFINVSNDLKNPLLGWESAFGLIMLKIISYNVEYANSQEKKQKNNKLYTKDNIFEHCKECKNGKFCLTALKFLDVNEEDFNFINLLIYIFYPPFYFSGPTILYHSFIFQVNNININKHNDTFDTNKMLYCIRCILVFIIFEIFNHYIYVNAIMTNKYNNFFLQDFINANSYFTYSFLAFNNLVFIFLKFSLIWKVARFWGWADGIYAEENMNRCIYNNYSFEGFWRQWHRSYNIWLIRYMYIPLGGNKKRIFNFFIIFSFVALWHDLKFHLLLWAWGIYIVFIPEVFIKFYFNKEENKYLNDYMIFRYLRALVCSFVILMMMLANLIGFGIGNKNLVDTLWNLIKMTTPLRFFGLVLFYAPFTFVMFFIREVEKNNGIEKKF